VSRAIVARAPTRLDFGGGWTDVPPYSDREGGAVCNLAIARYTTATVASGGCVAARTGSPNAAEDRLFRAALRHSPISNVYARLSNDFPVGAGLGGSSAAGVALAGALAELAGSPLAPHALAMLSRETEVAEIGMPGGFQDHFAAAFGGALLLTFEKGNVGVEQIALSVDAGAALARRSVLVYTGESRISGDTITAVRDAYLAGERRVLDALARMKALAREMASALRAEDLDTLGMLVSEHWTYQRALHPAIPTARIDTIVRAAARSGALGAKALGASGGGCVLAIARDGREDELARALAPLGERLTFSVDTTGFDVLAVLDGQESFQGEQE
jgi:D-glycero-alpha-D-manno-heptose-7-phosphate kinase